LSDILDENELNGMDIGEDSPADTEVNKLIEDVWEDFSKQIKEN